MENKNIYFDLFNLPGIAGSEQLVKKYLKTEFEKYADEVIYDKLGGIYGIKKGPKNSPIIMVGAHMDEVGAMVLKLKDNGLIKMKAIGGLNGNVFSSQIMTISLQNGKKISGVTTTIPPHLKKTNNSTADFDDLFLDVGAKNKEELEQLDITVGDMITVENRIVENSQTSTIISKAVDDRWGCGLLVELLKDLKDDVLDCTLVVAGTVQEEVGLRGAQVAGSMIKPDLFIAVDVSPVSNLIAKEKRYGELGEGFLLRIRDRFSILPTSLKKWIVELAEKNGLKYQYFYSPGATDTARVELTNNGVIAGTIGLPGRYLHSSTTMFDTNDHQAAKGIVFKIVRGFSEKTLNKLKRG